MSLARRAKRRDENEAEIVAALRQLGCLVWQLDEPCDLLVVWKGQKHLLEVKNPDGKAKNRRKVLTKRQRETWKQWGEHITIVKSLSEAFRAIGAEVAGG